MNGERLLCRTEDGWQRGGALVCKKDWRHLFVDGVNDVSPNEEGPINNIVPNNRVDDGSRQVDVHIEERSEL